MKRLFCFFIATLCISWLCAQSVSKELATKVALQYIKNDVSNAAPSDFSPLIKNNAIDTTYTYCYSPTGKAPLYVVQLQDGWILVASEFVSTPVLASAPKGQFPNITDMPDGLKDLLAYYEYAIQYSRDSIAECADDILKVWENARNPDYKNERATSSLPSSYEIQGIGSIDWGQSENNDTSMLLDCNKVYNKCCPTNFSVSCDHTLVGCNAVAMGIVMRYYQWPFSAIISDTIAENGSPSEPKHLVTYEWNKMPYDILNSTSSNLVDEVAGFLRDCGYACKMEYGNGGSSTSLTHVADALDTTFHYKSPTHYYRFLYLGNWINKLKSEIAANRPVIYSAYQNNTQGHSFVLYGYDAQDKFIINWGWRGGIENHGHFSLDDLTVNNTSYIVFGQEAIWGITPDYQNCNTYILQQSDVNKNFFQIYRSGSINANSVTINSNRTGVIYSAESITLSNGFKIEEGANVQLAIRNVQCNSRGDDSNIEDIENEFNAPLKKEMNNICSSASKILRDGQVFIIRNGRTYTLTGMEVR